MAKKSNADGTEIEILDEQGSPATAPLTASGVAEYEVAFTAITDRHHNLRRQGERVAADDLGDVAHLLRVGAIRAA